MLRTPSNEYQERPIWPTFQEYCTIRDFIQLQINTSGCPVRSYGDPFYDTLLTMENQWQYLRRVSGVLNPPNYSTYPSTNHSGPSLPHQTPGGSHLNRLAKVADQSKTVKKRAKKAKGNDGRPKRPLTSFMLFLKDHRDEIVASMPSGASSHDVNRAAGRRWHALSQFQKEDYKRKASEALQQWKADNQTPPAPSTESVLPQKSEETKMAKEPIPKTKDEDEDQDSEEDSTSSTSSSSEEA